jgi:hypothetical protein
MNTLQNVYDRLSDKTELAKHEVELGLIDNLTALNKKAKGYRETINFLFNTRIKLVDYSKKNRVDLINYLTELGDSRDKILISAKDLGLDPRNIVEYKNSLAHTAEIKDVIKIYDDFLSSGKL